MSDSLQPQIYIQSWNSQAKNAGVVKVVPFSKSSAKDQTGSHCGQVLCSWATGASCNCALSVLHRVLCYKSGYVPCSCQLGPFRPKCFCLVLAGLAIPFYRWRGLRTPGCQWSRIATSDRGDMSLIPGWTINRSTCHRAAKPMPQSKDQLRPVEEIYIWVKA